MDLDGSLKPFFPTNMFALVLLCSCDLVIWLFSVIVGRCPPPWLAYRRFTYIYTSIDSLVCALGVLLKKCCGFLSTFFPNSDSLGLFTLKADGHQRVHGARPGRGASQCPGAVPVVSWWCLGCVSFVS